MSLNMFQPKKETEDLLLSITKNCETLIKQTHRKAEETLEFKMTKPREIFHFTPPVQIKRDWMIGLTDLEVYNSIFDITDENNKLKLYKFPHEISGDISYEKIRDEIERDLDISNITTADLQDDIIAQNIIEEYKEQVTKRMKDVGYINILAGYVSSVFKISKVISERKLIRLKMILNWFYMNTIQVFLLMNYKQVYTLLKIFLNLFLTFFKH